MRKKHRYKKQTAKSSQIPSILFTLSTARMFKEALCLVKEGFLPSTSSLPNFELAHDTLCGLQVKLDDMLQREDWENKIPLDYNEIYMLYAAIHMYFIHLSINNMGNSFIAHCSLLCKEFSCIVEQMERHMSRT